MLNGMRGPITVGGQIYNNAMPPHSFLSDKQIAAVLTFVRSHFDNTATGIGDETVRQVRRVNSRNDLWTAEELWDAVGVPDGSTN
jgi:mono/diheme cytochrome c family protein